MDAVETFNTFAPLRPVNGFLALDFVRGCYRCSFCFNRFRFATIPGDRVIPYPITPASVASWILACPLYRQGTVLKVGHDSDQSLQIEPSWELYRCLPPGALLVFMRRRAVSREEYARFERATENLLLVVTLTPGSARLNVDGGDAWATLDSIRGLPNVMVAVRPVASDAVDEARALLAAIPPGTVVDVGGVIDKKHTGMSVKSAPETALDELARVSLSLGHLGNRSVNCVLRGRAGLGSHWADKKLALGPWATEGLCPRCASATLCEGHDNRQADLAARLEEARDVLGLGSLRIVSVDQRHLAMETDDDVNRGDQLYLRNLFGSAVSFPDRHLEDRLTPSIYARWRDRGFFPVDALQEAAAAMARELSGGPLGG